MGKNRLRCLIFMALCCDLGIFAKKLIVPAANIITDSLHIPGGIGTAFSLMFIVVAAYFVPRFGSATLMGAMQSGLALCLGTVGSMGALAPIGYIAPAFAIDCVLYAARKFRLGRSESIVIANAVASVAACLAANFIVFRLRGVVLALYVSVAAFSGTLCGVLGYSVAKKLEPFFRKEFNYEKKREMDNCGSPAADGGPCGGASDNAHP